MAKTYTLQGTVNAGFSPGWTDDDWREYTTANSLSGDDNKRRIVGKYSSNYRAVNITFDSTQLAALRGKTVTSVSLTVKLLVGEVAANSNLYKIGFKKNATASSSSTSADAYARESGSTTNGYVRKASSKMTAGNTYTITSTDGLSQSVPSYGYAIGVSQSATSYIILDTTATLTVTTNETDYSITLSYNANGGSGGPSAETKTGTASGTPSVAFTVSNTKPTRANASAGSYTVTYNANSGSVSPASASAARTTSYTFSKWNTKSGGGGTNYVGGDTITLSSSATLYAQWTSSTTTASVTLPTPTRANGTATYTVTYNANSGSVSPASATATKTTTYTFNKWNTKSDGSGTNYSAGAAYTPETNTTLYARWSSSASTTSVTLPTPSRTGYTFNGWYDASSGGTKVGNAGASYTPSGNITLYAQWTIKTYTVSYNKGSNGTGTNTSDTKTHGTDLTLKGAIFTRTGYTQTGWSTTDGGSKTYNLSASYTANAAVTLYPFWTINTYTVYYKKGDYGTGTNTSDTKTYGTALTLKGAIFTRTGYTQTGWSTASNGSSKDYNLSGSYTTNAGTTLYPYWTINTYTVSYNANGGSGEPSSQTKTHGTDLTLSSTKPTKSQTTTTYTVTYNANSGSVSPASATATKTTTYTFSTWNTKSDGTGNSYSSGGKYTANESATLYARYTSATSTTSVTLPTPTRTGYTFNGWYDAASGGNKIGNGGTSYTPTGNKTLYAHWTAATYTIKYDANGGTGAPASQTKTYGQDLTLQSGTPTRSNATTNYTVTFNANDGNVSPSSSAATKTTTYSFSKWNTASNGSGTDYNPSGTYSANVAATLYAQWTSSASTTSVTLPTPTRTGYTFNGWYTAASGGTRRGGAGDSYTPTASVTLYAQWTIITYTITYKKGTYGTGTNTTATKTYGVALTLKDAIFTRTGYTQKGWSTAAAGTSKAYNLKASYTSNSAKTLYPYWEANTYAVKYNANGGSGAPSAQTKTYGVTLTLSSTKPTRSGYNFIQWNTKADGTGTNYASGGNYTANDAATLYAVWAAAASTVSTTNGTLGTAQTITITRNSSSYTHNLSYTYGSQTGTIATGVGTSYSWTPPTSMASAFPSSTSGTCTITCVTKSGSTTIGTTTTTCTLSIPSSIKPSGVALTASHYSANSTVSGWATFTKGYSQADLSVTYTLNGGATLASITFSGPGMSSTGTSTTARTSVLTTSGTNTWTVTVKDSRGRTASATASKTVYDYANPVISSIGTYRCDSDGTINNGSGAYVKFLPKFSVSSVNSKNSMQSAKLKWRVSGGSWSSQINVTNNTYTAVLGSGNIDITKTYEVSVTVTDKLNSTTATATLPSASGLWYGRGNDRLGLGGVPPSAGLHCDWNATFNGVLDVTPRRCYATLSSAGWYRVCTFSGSNLLYTGGIIKFYIVQYFDNGPSANHEITLSCVSGGAIFRDESSDGGAIISKIRLTGETTNTYHVDIYYTLSESKSVDVFFRSYVYNPYQYRLSAASLASVAASPSGETVLTEYNFDTTARCGIVSITTDITVGNNGFTRLVGYTKAQYTPLSVTTTKADAHVFFTGASSNVWIRTVDSDGSCPVGETVNITATFLKLS